MKFNPKTEHIVTAYAERCSGPGWANFPVWVVIRQNGTSNVRVDAIQPSEQTPELMKARGVSDAMNRLMVEEVTAALRKPRRKRAPK